MTAKTVQPLSSLRVVGYADRLNSIEFPVRVPAIYFDAKLNLYILPPYSLAGGALVGGTQVDAQQLQEFEAAGSLTLLKDDFRAREGFTLWVDSDGHARYDDSDGVTLRFRSLSDKWIDDAELALDRMDLDEALCLSRWASAVDNGSLYALGLEARILKQMRALPNANVARIDQRLSLVERQASRRYPANRFWAFVDRVPSMIRTARQHDGTPRSEVAKQGKRSSSRVAVKDAVSRVAQRLKITTRDKTQATL